MGNALELARELTTLRKRLEFHRNRDAQAVAFREQVQHVFKEMKQLAKALQETLGVNYYVEVLDDERTVKFKTTSEEGGDLYEVAQAYVNDKNPPELDVQYWLNNEVMPSEGYMLEAASKDDAFVWKKGTSHVDNVILSTTDDGITGAVLADAICSTMLRLLCVDVEARGSEARGRER